MISKELESLIVVSFRTDYPPEQIKELLDFVMKLTEIISEHATENKYSSAHMVTLLYLLSEHFHQQVKDNMEKKAVELYKQATKSDSPKLE